MDVTQQIRLRLREYLHLMGIDVDEHGYAYCPLHNDRKTKSFTVAGPSGEHMWKCFGCGKGGDIFTLANELEGLPLKGSEFRTVTIPTLAKRFNIPLTYKVQDDATFKQSKLIDLFSFVKEQLVIDDIVKSFAKERDLDINLFKRMGIGRIPNFRSLMTKLKRRFKKETIAEARIDHKDLFVDRILFTLHNENGQPVGFGGRYIGKDDNDAKKYVNSYNNPLFNKSSYLYNMHLVKSKDCVYVVEGYTDVIRLIQNGIQNVVGTCGTAVTENHVKQLRNFKSIILTLDGDKAGLERMDKVRKILPQATCKIIPNEMDPDSYVRNYGIDAFLRLENLDSLSWEIMTHKYYQRNKDAEQFLFKIADTLPHFHKEYLKKLAAASGLRFIDLQSSLNTILNKRNWKVLEQILHNQKQIASLTIQIKPE